MTLGRADYAGYRRYVWHQSYRRVARGAAVPRAVRSLRQLRVAACSLPALLLLSQALREPLAHEGGNEPRDIAAVGGDFLHQA